MSWANSVLPVFRAASGQIPGRLPESAIAVQIDTTLHRSEIRVSHGFQRFAPSFNRTVVVMDIEEQADDGMNLGKRIEARLAELGWSRNDLLGKVPELTAQSLSALITRDSKRSEHDVAIAAALGVNLVWLNSGKGDKTLHSHDAIAATTDETINIPLSPLVRDPHLACILPVHKGMSIHKTWVQVFFPDLSSTKDLVIMSVSGFSMAPTFGAGDLLLMDKGFTKLATDGIYAFTMGDTYTIKRLQLRPDGSILVKSDNVQYEPMIIPPENADKLRILGRIIYTWTGKRL